MPEGRYDPRHYRRVHHHFFQDVYTWAGRYRTVRTSKGGNFFCYPEYIAEQMNRPFTTVPELLAVETKERFALQAAQFLGDLNAIHPFREGNGRVQLAFLSMLGARAGFPIHFVRVRRATFMPAMIASFKGDIDPLTEELNWLLD